MIVPRNQRQAAAMGLAATLAPTFAPLIRNGASRAFDYMTTASSGTTQHIQQIIRASHEPKNLDSGNTAGLSGTTTPVLTLLNPITQGVTGNSRSGRQVLNQSLDIRFMFDTDPSSLQDDVVRIIVFRDKESRGAAPAVGDLLRLVGSLQYEIVSQYNFDNVPSRFQILADDVVSVPNRTSPTTTTSNLTRVCFNRRMKLNFKTHFYNTSAGNITDIDDGAIYLMLIGSQSVKVSSYYYDARLVFRDL
jgi:hypothetical protein